MAYADDGFGDDIGPKHWWSTWPPSNRTWLALGAILLFLTLASQTYVGRVTFRNQALAGCGRSTDDRLLQVRLLRASAHSNFLASVEKGRQHIVQVARRQESDLQTAAADGLASRTSADPGKRREFCERAYPPPSLWPWAG